MHLDCNLKTKLETFNLFFLYNNMQCYIIQRNVYRSTMAFEKRIKKEIMTMYNNI